MKLKKWGFILLIGLLLTALAACGTSDLPEESTSANDGEDVEENTEVDDNSESEEEAEPESEDNVLRMATSADFPPFESFDESGEFIGFDIDLANIVADELGYELEIDDMNFDGLIGSLQSGRADIVLAGMSATEERSENVDFSPAYHHSGEMFITQPDSDITSIEDIEGLTVGVQLGTIQEEGAKTLQEEYDFEIKQLDEATGIVQELLTNRIDVGYLDKTVAEGYIEEQDLAGFDDPTTASPGMAIAFPKDSEYYEEVSEVIEQLLEDGTIADLEEKWGLDEQ
ncbi:ABC transporter substrate-binding protein [Alkalibacillus aidingensis]|uniref:ABC transporter substrate-binding protein n=1 Tax=Alkalibacillus aidingensis TaxID=2747607 RepID=UPI001661717E|nr:ABC transporter substrate-binding protein [Alkalibacillus aidingensis]